MVSEELDVSVHQINQWIREERLSFSEDSGVMISCEKCGKNIRTGRYCDGCKASLARELTTVYQRDMANMSHGLGGSKEDKMRYLGRK